MGTTPIYNLPYQELTDPPHGPDLGKNLANAVESELDRIDGRLDPQPVEAFETANDTTASTTYVNGTLHGCAFTAPPSGSVIISFGGDVGNNGTAIGHATYLTDYIRTGSTVGSGADVMAASDDRAIKFYCSASTAGFRYQTAMVRHLVTGLTPGNSYNVITQFRASHSTDTAAINDRRVLVEPVP